MHNYTHSCLLVSTWSLASLAPELQGAVIGAITALATGLLGYLGAQRAARLQIERASELEQQERLQSDRFSIYLKLAKLNELYYWLSASEFHNRLDDDPTGVRGRCHELSSDIANDVRRVANLDETEEILDILFNEEAYPSFAKRSDALNALTIRLLEATSPRFSDRLVAIGQANLRAFYLSSKKTAPMSFDLISENVRRMEVKQRRGYEAIQRGEAPPDDD